MEPADRHSWKLAIGQLCPYEEEVFIMETIELALETDLRHHPALLLHSFDRLMVERTMSFART